MNLLMDFVGSVKEAADFCKEGLPHAVIVESAQLGERYAAFRAEILDEVPDFVFIEIVEDGATLRDVRAERRHLGAGRPRGDRDFAARPP